MHLKLAKISVSNINQVLSSLKTYQAHLYFSKLPGITYISINYRKGLYSIDLAAQSGSLEIVKYLVERGADVNCKNNENKSVLHYAVEFGNKSVLHYAAKSGSLEIVKYLIDHGSNVDLADERIFDYLSRHGLMKDIDDWDHSGRSLLTIACNGGDTALVQRLLKYAGIRKEKELVCKNEEIAIILGMGLKKSIKHRHKIGALNILNDEKLKKVYIAFYIGYTAISIMVVLPKA